MKKIIGFALISTLTCLMACSPKQNDQPTMPKNDSISSMESVNSNTKLNDTNTIDRKNNRAIFSKQAIGIFYQACALNAGDEQKVNNFARSQKMLELNAEQKQTFRFEPEAKTVWGIKTPEGGQFYLAVGENFCSLKARFADMNTVIQEFSKMSEQSAKTHGLTATVMTDREVNDKVASHQKVYTLSKANSPSQFILTAQASDSDQIMAQAVLNFRTISAKP